MSGGEQQMVAVGRALMSHPGILLVEQNARQSLTIADRGYLLETGRLVGEGTARQLQDDPAVRRAYLGGAAA